MDIFFCVNNFPKCLQLITHRQSSKKNFCGFYNPKKVYNRLSLVYRKESIFLILNTKDIDIEGVEMPISEVPPNKIKKILRLTLNKCENEAISHLKEISSNCRFEEISYKNTGDTILHYAARNGMENLFQYLYKTFDNINFDCRNKDGKTPLHEAAQFSQYIMCALLLDSGAMLHSLKRGDWTPVMLACTKFNAVETLEILMSRGANIEYKNKDGWTCLHLASREGNKKVVKMLLQSGASAQNTTNNGRSALNIAALHGHLDIVELLLKYCADVNSKDKCGNSAVCEAVLGNHLKILLKLLEHRADSKIINNCGYSLIHLAASEGHIDMLKFILETLHVDVNFTNKNGLTALHCAARKKRAEAYAYLVMNGASERITDNYKRTPLDYLNF